MGCLELVEQAAVMYSKLSCSHFIISLRLLKIMKPAMDRVLAATYAYARFTVDETAGPFGEPGCVATSPAGLLLPGEVESDAAHLSPSF